MKNTTSEIKNTLVGIISRKNEADTKRVSWKVERNIQIDQLH